MTARSPTPNEVLGALATEIREVVGRELVGLYVYGSYVSGGFEPDASDLDLVAILETEVGEGHIARLGPLHDDFVRRNPSWSNRLDVVYIGRRTLAGFRGGRGSFAVISPGEPFHVRTDAADWLQSWYLLREASRPLFGVEAAELVPPVTRGEFLAAVSEHAELMRARSREERSPGALAYELLTVCRALQTVSTDANPSKAEAAGLVRERWPAWAPLIDAALACRRSGGRLGFDDKTSRDAARRFIGEMADEVAAIRRASPG